MRGEKNFKTGLKAWGRKKAIDRVSVTMEEGKELKEKRRPSQKGRTPERSMPRHESQETASHESEERTNLMAEEKATAKKGQTQNIDRKVRKDCKEKNGRGSIADNLSQRRCGRAATQGKGRKGPPKEKKKNRGQERENERFREETQQQTE